MAKKKKSQSSDKAAAAPDKKAAAPSTEKTEKAPAERALAAGNYAAIHALARQGDEKARQIEPLTTVDMGQVVVGVIAIIVVLLVMFVTLHG